MKINIKKIVSGGQTGVDRAALDTARKFGIPIGGWCPKERRAEDGRITTRYPLRETPSDDYEQRTEWNVRDSDGTLIITIGIPVGGTAFTITQARKLNKPYFVIDLSMGNKTSDLLDWFRRHNIRELNIAGPRESSQPGIYVRAKDLLERIFVYVTGETY